MEYLMTYGWAILIIAVVLVALFQLGVFNSSNFAPKAQPGSCQVFKTTATTTLEGTCNNMLPQYVAQFNGQTSYINLGSAFSLNSYIGGSFTVGLWADPTCTSGTPATLTSIASGGWASNTFIFYICQPPSAATVYWDGLDPITYGTTSFAANSWNYFVISKQGNTLNLYVDGANVITGTTSTTFVAAQTFIGAGDANGAPVQYYPGSLSNVQIYNTSLSANDVQALYTEGIGGHPLAVQNLVGWWPLNGNANDYSGNNNNGAAIGVIYSGSWASGYSAP